MNGYAKEHTMLAADNKQRKMLCLPEHIVFGWMFQVNPIKENPNLMKFKMKCIDALAQAADNNELPLPFNFQTL